MTKLMALSIVTGVLCGLWTQISGPLGLTAWMGFAGCTTYFASGKHGLVGFNTTVRQNLFGVLCGMTIIMLGTYLPFPGAIGFYSGIITFVMCIAGALKYLSFIPGTFVGCFSCFAANGDFKVLAISLVAGAVLGVGCDLGGTLLYAKTRKDPATKGEQPTTD